MIECKANIIKLLTVKDVSAILKAKASTVYAWAEIGILPCYKLNGLLRFSEPDILAWLENCKKQPDTRYNPLTGRRPKKGGQI